MCRPSCRPRQTKSILFAHVGHIGAGNKRGNKCINFEATRRANDMHLKLVALPTTALGNCYTLVYTTKTHNIRRSSTTEPLRPPCPPGRAPQLLITHTWHAPLTHVSVLRARGQTANGAKEVKGGVEREQLKQAKMPKPTAHCRALHAARHGQDATHHHMGHSLHHKGHWPAHGPCLACALSNRPGPGPGSRTWGPSPLPRPAVPR